LAGGDASSTSPIFRTTVFAMNDRENTVTGKHRCTRYAPTLFNIANSGRMKVEVLVILEAWLQILAVRKSMQWAVDVGLQFLLLGCASDGWSAAEYQKGVRRL